MATPAIRTFVLGVFETNCFVVRVPGRGGCWIVDCGFEPGPMLDWIGENGLEPKAILLTHTHPDHIAGVDEALGRFGPLPLCVHEAEAGFCSDPELNLSAAFGMPLAVTEPDRLLRDGERLDLEGESWRVVHAPGHSPGGALYVHDASRQAIVGDTIFAGSIGRMDFPTSDPPSFRRTIRDVVMRLPDDLTVYPGHGPATTIGHERATNPFIVQGF